MERRSKAPARIAKRQSKQALVCSFPPIAAPDARVLILGSVPSIASLAKQQYYGHPQNAFWPIMGRLFGAGQEVPYEQRKRVLHEHGVAVWDVIRECHREGSLDADIRAESESPNDFAMFFRKHPQIVTIFFNGQRTEVMFRRHVLPITTALDRSFRYVRLPSTSPAHAGRTFAEKLAAWRTVARALQDKKITTDARRARRRKKQ
jgi:double-stranded uracil-DNA glycosylase